MRRAAAADGRPDAAAVAAERDALRASLRAAEEALALTLADRQADKAVDRGADGQAGIERENADLRRRIAEVADALTEPGRMPRATYPVAQPERV